MKLSVIVPSLDGTVPQSLREQVAGHADVEIVSVVGLRPVGKARNEGLRRAQGDYIAWVDSDDEVTEDWLSAILRNIQPSPAQPDVLVFDASAEGWKGMGDLVYGGTNEGIVAAFFAEAGIQSALWRCVSRRGLWEGEAFDETIQTAEDVLLMPKIFCKAKRLIYLPRKLYRYIYHSGSAVNTLDCDKLADIMRVALRRYGESPAEYREAALIACMHSLYHCLQIVKIDPRYRGVRLDSRVSHAARLFMARHLLRVSVSMHTRIQYLTAILDFWLLQRLAHGYRFGRKSRGEGK